MVQALRPEQACLVDVAANPFGEFSQQSACHHMIEPKVERPKGEINVIQRQGKFPSDGGTHHACNLRFSSGWFG